MSNPIFRSRLTNSIRFALQEAKDAHLLNHHGLAGRVRELCCEHIVRPMLPAGFEVGTGKVSDQDGTLTAEADLVIHSPAVLPSIMHSARDGVFAVEATFYMLEVKSRLSATEVQDSIQKARQLAALKVGRDARPLKISWTIPILFAFDSDLSPESSELDRYAKYDDQWATAPLYQAICVAGRGYWYWVTEPQGAWRSSAATSDHDEIVSLVSGIANTLSARSHELPDFPLGRYLL